MTRLTSLVVRIALACGLAIASFSCAEPGAQDCGNGLFCPEGTRCAAADTVCITDQCGDLEMDPGEICDDGNKDDGDECAANCLSDESCGNAVVDDEPGMINPEVCDVGDTEDGDGCSADCLSTEDCGNDIMDVEIATPEVCDDGNQTPGDDCNATCSSDNSCGNGIQDDEVGEQCDDGGDPGGCTDDCSGGVDCHDGVIDPGEECDDGNVVQTDACVDFDSNNDGDVTDPADLCRAGRCGDGHVRVDASGIFDEECDTRGDSDTCDADCTLPSCGDGAVNPEFTPPDNTDPNPFDLPEECDNGTAELDTQNCTQFCTTSFCGDGYFNDADPLEDCDDAGDSADCNADCTLPSCGDGYLNPEFDPPGAITAEQCDDGNAIAGDGCDACKLEVCGDTVEDGAAGEECDDGNLSDLDDCVDSCQDASCGDSHVRDGATIDEECDTGDSSSTCDDDCTFPVCPDGFHNLLADRDLVTPGLQPEECDTGGASAGCDADCTFGYCGDGTFNALVDRAPTVAGFQAEQCDAGGNGATCDPDCTSASCGDGYINPAFDRDSGTAGVQPEICDDQNAVAGDGCTACKPDNCGDTVIDTADGEECDDGNAVDTDACTNNCQIAECGDGIDSATEPCDPGPATHTASCDFDCTAASCGDGILNPLVDRDPGTAGVQPELCDDGNAVAGDGCTQCKHDNCGDTVVDGADGEECDDGNAVDTDACTNNCQTAECGDGIDSATEACDPGPASFTAGCDYDCTAASCGDGIVNPLVDRDPVAGGLQPELCDDGNLTAGDGCSQCKPDNCGDTVVDSADGEECDDGNAVDTDACTNNCQNAECGDGIDSATEACDPGPATNTSTCDYDCTAASCGDGIWNPLVDRDPVAPGVQPEMCDDGNAVDGDGCTACKLDNCGDTVVDTLDGEECDDGNAVDTDACTNNCQTAECGDGIDSATEACDPGPATNTSTCDYDCTAASCGDGIWNPLVDRDLVAGGLQPEMCDDGNAVDGDGCTACKLDNCGDTVVDTADGEECDDGNAVDTDTCTNSCTNEDCGDGIDSASEFCDLGGGNSVGCDYDCTQPLCNDGVVNFAAGEQCDDGNAVVGDGCNACQLEDCGNGLVEAPNGEACDDDNALACGLCSATCAAAVTPTAATGTIVVVAAALIADGEIVTIDDGFGHIVVFEFDPADDGIAVTSDVDLDINAGNDEGQVRTLLVAEIDASLLDITTGTTGGAQIDLTNTHTSARGNQLITTTTAFTVNGMSGGLTQDCLAGTECTANGDCASDVCSSGVCQ